MLNEKISKKKIDVNLCTTIFDQKHHIRKNYEGKFSTNQILNNKFFLKKINNIKG
jgi:hypothetical protein